MQYNTRLIHYLKEKRLIIYLLKIQIQIPDYSLFFLYIYNYVYDIKVDITDILSNNECYNIYYIYFLYLY